MLDEDTRVDTILHLQAAKAELEDKGWSTGIGTATGATCLIGSLGRVYGYENVDEWWTYNIIEHLGNVDGPAIEALFAAIPQGWADLHPFDYKERTWLLNQATYLTRFNDQTFKSDVIELLDRAIAALQGQNAWVAEAEGVLEEAQDRHQSSL